jgi:hypothetical protein
MLNFVKASFTLNWRDILLTFYIYYNLFSFVASMYVMFHPLLYSESILFHNKFVPTFLRWQQWALRVACLLLQCRAADLLLLASGQHTEPQDIHFRHTRNQCRGSGSGSAIPHVFGPPGSESGSISKGYGSGSGSFYHEAKIVRKTLISNVLCLLFDFFLWKIFYVKVSSKSNLHKNFS